MPSASEHTIQPCDLTWHPRKKYRPSFAQVFPRFSIHTAQIALLILRTLQCFEIFDPFDSPVNDNGPVHRRSEHHTSSGQNFHSQCRKHTSRRTFHAQRLVIGPGCKNFGFSRSRFMPGNNRACTATYIATDTLRPVPPNIKMPVPPHITPQGTMRTRIDTRHAPCTSPPIGQFGFYRHFLNVCSRYFNPGNAMITLRIRFLTEM